MKLTVTVMEGDAQTKKPAVETYYFCISLFQARGMETMAFAVGDGFIKNLCKICEKSGEMIAHGPPLSLLQDKT